MLILKYIGLEELLLWVILYFEFGIFCECVIMKDVLVDMMIMFNSRQKGKQADLCVVLVGGSGMFAYKACHGLALCPPDSNLLLLTKVP